LNCCRRVEWIWEILLKPERMGRIRNLLHGHGADNGKLP
jgi:hypothetical protein